MSLKLLVCLSLSLFAVAAVANPKIEAEEGENVSLRCLMDPPVDVSDSTVEWSKDGRANIVHLYIDGRDRAGDQKKAFTNRTVLFHEGLTRGNVTLQLSHVKLSDNGTYRCHIVRWKTYCYTVLEVVKKGQLSRSQRNDSSTTRPSLDEVPKPDDPAAVPKIEAEEGENVSLGCLMDPPMDVSDSTVEWSKDSRANIVHLYIDGRDRAGDQKKAFTNRTVLFHEGLTRGNVTLQLSHVKLSDNGTYRCHIVRWKTYCYTVLEVVKKGQLSRSQRNDSSTTRPSLDEVPKPDDPVSGIFCVVLLAVIGTICGTVWFYRKVQGRRGRRTEVTANGAEMQNLRSVGRDAESGSGNDQPEEQTERRTD
ncbi:hypothetical protein Q5P01_025685 [Channa striata]|uniref:Ig-like domain-containing protein n=1 Tax=Channa striata TaxID=64152 RepID=A0AA88J2B6_CHASR|nr:hypothetical protein Q5P01_025685 [Channa striata]